MRIPVLTYHAVNVDGNDYANNDHVAFAADLRLIHAEGLRIVPLAWVVDGYLGPGSRDLGRCVALSCDDGADFDYHDLEHPSLGVQRSLFNALLDFRREFGVQAQPHLHLTSFVIASPAARSELDRRGLIGRGWWNDHWWRPAQASGLMAIENHSWDHNHDAIAAPGLEGMTRGSFLEVNNLARARAEIVQAARYLDERLAPRRSTLFCYPYGHVSTYLRDEYLPQQQDEHGLRAAFSDGGEPVTASSPRWNLPRYICGHDWKSPDALRAILREAR